MIDPVLQAEGQKLERERAKGGFKLGPYTVAEQRLNRRSVTPAEEIELEVSLDGPEGRHWTARCDAVRRITPDRDYGAVLDESQDAVKIDCRLDDGHGAEWTFEADGTLATNFGGKLVPKSASIVGGALNVEILMWRKRFDRVRRHLPRPIAQVKMGEAAIAAMVLSWPEQAWLATDASHEFREVSLVTLAALDLLPLGFDG